MGFLDRMLADVVGNATGLPVRGIVRRVGAGNLLLLGGAAVAGGLVADAMARQRSSGPPPPPPTPGASGATSPQQLLPPLPPSAEDELPPLPEPPLSPALQLAIVRTMVAAALADGRLGDEERRSIRERLTESDLDDTAVARVRAELALPAEPEELAASVGDPEGGAALYRAAWLVTRADRAVERSESEWLDRLAAALGLDAARREALESDLGRLLHEEPAPEPPPSRPEDETR